MRSTQLDSRWGALKKLIAHDTHAVLATVKAFHQPSNGFWMNEIIGIKEQKILSTCDRNTSVPRGRHSPILLPIITNSIAECSSDFCCIVIRPVVHNDRLDW